MKYLLLIIVLYCACPLYSDAQEDSTSLAPDGRVMFRSKVRQLTSYLNEGNSVAADILFKDVAKAMDGFIRQTQQDIGTTTSTNEKKKLKAKSDRQRQLAGQFHSFKSDLMRNREAIDVWTDQFIKTLY